MVNEFPVHVPDPEDLAGLQRAAREHQIALIGEVGAGLDIYVRRPFIESGLSMMRQPARLAGLAALQDFLERGVRAFRKLHGAK